MPVSESQWAFDVAESELHRAWIILGVMTCVWVACIVTKKQKWITKNGSKSSQRPIGWIALVWGITVFAFEYRSAARMRRIETHAREAVGITLEARPHSKGYDYPFTFPAQGSNHTEIEVRGRDHSFVNPGGQYIVIYNSEDPTEAFMDARRPVLDSIPGTN